MWVTTGVSMQSMTFPWTHAYRLQYCGVPRLVRAQRHHVGLSRAKGKVARRHSRPRVRAATNFATVLSWRLLSAPRRRNV